ncbi:hypothetical protein BJ165DRAFT_1512655 [Panaeolus papilionaceus]|nr:hypothetical protein BJ165DRAFT_1512655 [Panaeolus papilionaceus]
MLTLTRGFRVLSLHTGSWVVGVLHPVLGDILPVLGVSTRWGCWYMGAGLCLLYLLRWLCLHLSLSFQPPQLVVPE